MSTQQKDLCRAEIIRDLYSIDNEDTLVLFKQMLHSYVEIEAQSTKPYTFDEIIERIDEGEKQEEAGRVSSHEDVMANLRKHIAV